MSNFEIELKNMDFDNGILHEAGNYWVSNEGTNKKPSFHVWKNGLTHSTADSAYNDLSLAIARANFLNKYSGKKVITNK